MATFDNRMMVVMDGWWSFWISAHKPSKWSVPARIRCGLPFYMPRGVASSLSRGREHEGRFDDHRRRCHWLFSSGGQKIDVEREKNVSRDLFEIEVRDRRKLERTVVQNRVCVSEFVIWSEFTCVETILCVPIQKKFLNSLRVSSKIFRLEEPKLFWKS